MAGKIVIRGYIDSEHNLIISNSAQDDYTLYSIEKLLVKNDIPFDHIKGDNISSGSARISRDIALEAMSRIIDYECNVTFEIY